MRECDYFILVDIPTSRLRPYLGLKSQQMLVIDTYLQLNENLGQMTVSSKQQLNAPLRISIGASAPHIQCRLTN